MKDQALKYYMHDGLSAFRLELSGDLSGEGARRLERDWRSASSEIGRRTLNVDMTNVTGADEEGRALLNRWYSHGAQLIARSKTSRELAEGIVGHSLPASMTAGTTDLDLTWLPFGGSFPAPARNRAPLFRQAAATWAGAGNTRPAPERRPKESAALAQVA